jgi:hypothetical protein
MPRPIKAKEDGSGVALKLGVKVALVILLPLEFPAIVNALPVTSVNDELFAICSRVKKAESVDVATPAYAVLKLTEVVPSVVSAEKVSSGLA